MDGWMDGWMDSVLTWAPCRLYERERVGLGPRTVHSIYRVGGWCLSFFLATLPPALCRDLRKEGEK